MFANLGATLPSLVSGWDWGSSLWMMVDELISCDGAETWGPSFILNFFAELSITTDGSEASPSIGPYRRMNSEKPVFFEAGLGFFSAGFLALKFKWIVVCLPFLNLKIRKKNGSKLTLRAQLHNEAISQSSLRWSGALGLQPWGAETWSYYRRFLGSKPWRLRSWWNQRHPRRISCQVSLDHSLESIAWFQQRWWTLRWIGWQQSTRAN